jgi:rhamnosyltransferase subunit B
MQPAVLWSRGDPPRLPGPYVPNWLRGVQYAIGQRFFIDPVVCPGLNRFRAGLGLPPVRRILEWYHSRWCVACLFPDWFAAPQPEWPSPRLQSDFPLWDEPEGDDLPAAVQAFLDAGTPPIAFTPGSANVHGREFFATAAEVCRRLGRRGILLTRFPEQLPAALPDGVRHFPYVPFTTLLPRCAAAVHHGGIGTTAQSLAAGIPQFIMALAHDQYDNGERVARLGVGDWVTAARFHPRTVTPRLMRLLSSDDVLQRCRGIAPRMTGRSGLATMAAAIERFVQETPPPQPLASR